MQAPAAPQHELMVQEDGRDWALEQMAQAAAPSAAANADPSARQTLFEDISAGESATTMPAAFAAAMTHTPASSVLQEYTVLWWRAYLKISL